MTNAIDFVINIFVQDKAFAGVLVSAILGVVGLVLFIYKKYKK